MKVSRLKKHNKILIFLLMFIVILQTAALAEGPYFSYGYEHGDSYPTSVGYLPEQVITGSTLGISNMKAPQDMVFKNNCLYVLDSGNNRVVVLDKNLKFIKSITPKLNSKPVSLSKATGLFVDKNGIIYIADTGNKAVHILKQDGQIFDEIQKPKSDLIHNDFMYQPIKVTVDSNGMIYVISDGWYYGALLFNQKHEFMGFYGSESVGFSFELVAKMMWKPFLSKKQVNSMFSVIPDAYNNFDIDKDDFIYTVKDATGRGQVRKINALGTNILWHFEKYSAQQFGDVAIVNDNQTGLIQSSLKDVDITDDNYINVLDVKRGRVFQYDQNSDLMFVFGGMGYQKGTFKAPVAIESIGNKVFVLDSEYNSITEFKPTDFAKNVQSAVKYYSDGKYQEAFPYWQKVIKYDNNYNLGNIGIGKSYEAKYKFDDALYHYKLADDSYDYSTAFYTFRTRALHNYFPLIMLGILAIIIVPMVLSRVLRKHKKDEYSLVVGKIKYPFYTMIHPYKGYSALKYEKKGSMLISCIIVACFFIIEILNTLNTGFVFNHQLIEYFNIFIVLVKTAGIFVVFVLANWAVSTLLDGEGKFTEIWIFTAYALVPYILISIPALLCSNFMTRDEGAFYYLIVGFGIAWSALSLLIAIKEVHQFSLTKTIAIILLTALGIVLIAVLYALLYSMATQMVGFIMTIFNEIVLRMN